MFRKIILTQENFKYNQIELSLQKLERSSAASFAFAVFPAGFVLLQNHVWTTSSHRESSHCDCEQWIFQGMEIWQCDRWLHVNTTYSSHAHTMAIGNETADNVGINWHHRAYKERRTLQNINWASPCSLAPQGMYKERRTLHSLIFIKTHSPRILTKVIEPTYRSYRVDSLHNTRFTFNQFREGVCPGP